MNIDAKRMIKLRLKSPRAELSKDGKIIFLASIFMKLFSFEYRALILSITKGSRLELGSQALTWARIRPS
jgi:hypothetical protein